MRLSLLLSISLALSHAVASAYAHEDSTFPKLAATTQDTKDTKAATSYSPDMSEDESFWREEDYCYDDKDYACYKKGVPSCCTKSERLQTNVCPIVKPKCEFRRRGGGIRRADVGPNGYCEAGVDVCVGGYECIDRVCVRGNGRGNGRAIVGPRRTRPGRRHSVRRDSIGRGGVCQIGVDVCVDGYSCIGGRCAVPAAPRYGACGPGLPGCANGLSCLNGRCDIVGQRSIGRGGVCQIGVDVCVDGYSCINGRCAIPAVPRSGACGLGDTCANGQVCLNGRCGTGMWYKPTENVQYCVMDCPSNSHPCCGGSAQAWEEAFPSADACCGQSAFQGNRERCQNKSLQCLGEDSDDEAALAKTE